MHPSPQTTSSDLRSTLVFIWAKVLALDKSCQVGREACVLAAWVHTNRKDTGQGCS